MSKPEVLVVGAGVSGLSSGILLIKAGYEVHIWAKDLPPNTTSNIAAAFWYPYLAKPVDKVTKWSGYTLKYLKDNLISDPATGCVTRTVHEFFDHKVDDPSWRSAVENFRRLEPHEIPEGYVDGYATEAALMDTSIYMDWLMSEYQRLGGTIEQKAISKLDEALAVYDIVVNCTGLGARELCNDTSLYPVRGQIVKVKPTGFELVINDDYGPNGLCYIVPRINDVVLGGTEQEHDSNLGIDDQDTEDILRKAWFFSPSFNNAEIIEIKVGLRPVRDEVRVEAESFGNKYVVHNYGHGGAGFTLSWGCAQEVTDIVNQFDTL